MVRPLSERSGGDLITAAPPGGRRLRYQPALDGLRGIAVAAVLLFHGGFSWAKGGWLGVSLFFTLSGYLITSLLLAEHHSTGAIRLSSFWSRRFRRLMPASLLCLFGTIVLVAVYLAAAEEALRGDVISCLAYVANWHFWWEGQSYGALFSAPSPLLHFWSLAIEEQFYIFFPLLAWWVLSRRRSSLPMFGVVLAVLFAASTALAIIVGAGDPDLAYYATFTRVAELLTGCVLAVVLARRSVPRVFAVVGLLAFAAVIALMVLTPQSADWLYHGGLPAFGVLSAVLVAGTLPAGPLRAGLAVVPLVWLGRISYGVYLFHWPLFLVLTPARTGLDGAPLFAVRVGVTLAVAVASYVMLETPIRTGRALHGWAARAAPAAGIAVVIAVLIPVTAPSSATVVTAPLVPATTTATTLAATTALATTIPGLTTTTPTTPTTPPTTVVPTTTTTVPVSPVRIVVFGDSTAESIASGLTQWGNASGWAAVTDDGADKGCGMLGEGRRRFGTTREAVPSQCRSRPARWSRLASSADVAVLATGPWDVTDYLLPGDDTWRAVGDPVFEDALYRELLAATDSLLTEAAAVVWLTSPHIHAGWGLSAEVRDDPINDPFRMDRLNALIARVAAERPAVKVVDLAGYVVSLPGNGELDEQLRPDGVHFSDATSLQVAQWLGPAIVTAAAG